MASANAASLDLPTPKNDEETCTLVEILGLSYSVATDRVEYFLPGRFEKLLAEVASVQGAVE